MRDRREEQQAHQAKQKGQAAGFFGSLSFSPDTSNQRRPNWASRPPSTADGETLCLKARRPLPAHACGQATQAVEESASARQKRPAEGGRLFSSVALFVCSGLVGSIVCPSRTTLGCTEGQLQHRSGWWNVQNAHRAQCCRCSAHTFSTLATLYGPR